MQGQFPCPKCGQPILIMIHRKGDIARCLACGARAPVPEQLDPPETQEVLTKLETAKQLTVEEEFEQLRTILDSSYMGLLEECIKVTDMELSREGSGTWCLCHRPHSPSQFWIDLLLGSQPIEVTVATGNDHTHLDWILDGQPMKAAQWFRKGLSGEMRLVVFSGAKGEIYHDVEILNAGKWECVGGGRGCFLFRRGKVTGKTILINHVLPPGELGAL